MLQRKIGRRQFLESAAGAVAVAIGFPYIVKSSVFGANGTILPSERIVMGCIGVGGQGTGDMKGFLEHESVQVVAVCDVNRESYGYQGRSPRGREPAKRIVEEHYAKKKDSVAYKGCAAYEDFRELIARNDIDAVLIATPDHWHAIPVIEAASAGKDIYCEKPLSLTVAQARAMVNAVRRYGRVFQTGSQQRSSYWYWHGCELIRNGYIGEVKTILVGVGGTSGACYLPAESVPEGLNWDMWLGPAPARPYNIEIQQRWRAFQDYSGGQMTDFGAHNFDIAQWGLGMDDSGPVEIYPPEGEKEITYKYANGVTMTRRTPKEWKEYTVLFTGTKGKVEMHREFLHTWPENLAKHQISPNEIRLYRSDDHFGNFLDCIRSRRKTVADVEIGCRSVTVCHLGNIAYQLNRPLKWDPAQEQFVNDAQANRMLKRPMRSPWHL